MDLEFHQYYNKILQYNPYRTTYVWTLPPKCVCSCNILRHIFRYLPDSPFHCRTVVCYQKEQGHKYNFYVRKMSYWLLLNVRVFK